MRLRLQSAQSRESQAAETGSSTGDRRHRFCFRADAKDAGSPTARGEAWLGVLPEGMMQVTLRQRRASGAGLCGGLLF